MIEILLSVIVYAMICFVSLIGTILYFHAYREMKRTKIIGALAMLLCSIFIDSVF